MTKARAALAKAAETLDAAGIEGAGRDARKLLAHAMAIEAHQVSLMLGEALDSVAAERFAHLVAERAKRVPVAHLIGERWFRDHRFEVGPDVLDPRPDTETLIEVALEAPFLRVLDLGTGSGCIIATLLAEAGVSAFGIGTDLSPAALAVAGRNAARLGVQDRVQFLAGDWFAALPGGMADFDLIVSNPPYIAADEMPGLAPEVRDYEPRMALTDEADGLSAYRAILSRAGDHLTQGGRLIVEIGHTQGPAVAEMMRQAGFAQVRIVPDLNGHDRVVAGQKPRNQTTLRRN